MIFNIKYIQNNLASMNLFLPMSMNHHPHTSKCFLNQRLPFWGRREYDNNYSEKKIQVNSAIVIKRTIYFLQKAKAQNKPEDIAMF